MNTLSAMDKRKLTIVLAFLAIVNFLGGLVGALFIDARLIWIAVVIPGLAMLGIFLTRRRGA